MGRVLLLWGYFVMGGREGVKIAFVQYMECVLPWDAMEKALRCVCLRWATTNGPEDEKEVGRFIKETDETVAGETFGAISNESNLSTVRLVAGNTPGHPSTTKLPWTLHRL